MISYGEQLSELESHVERLRSRLLGLQNRHDGGFKAFHVQDKVSGLWTTAEAIHILCKTFGVSNEPWLTEAANFLRSHQNTDGGWSFRPGGKSITDITAWACLALSHWGVDDHVRRGVQFILAARNNQGSVVEEAWGLTQFEVDRVYSTWIAAYCLHRLLRATPDEVDLPVSEMRTALSEARLWLLRSRLPDGSWASTTGGVSSFTSTAVALHTLLTQGENPSDFTSSCHFLRTGLKNGLWEAESEVVVTQEGYELNQEWFTSVLCFRSTILFAEMGLVSIAEIDGIYRSLVELILPDGSVLLGRNASGDLVWTIIFMIEALDKYRGFIRSKQREYSVYLEEKRTSAIQQRRHEVEYRLQHQFPFPISQAFSSYRHELDYHRKFQLLLQLYEVTVKYACIVGLSAYLGAREAAPTIGALIRERLRRPSLGDWCALLTLLLKESAGFAKLLQPSSGGEVLKARADALESTPAKTNLSETLANVVALRNASVGHGALRTIFEDKLAVESEEPALYTFFDRVSFLAACNSFLVLTSNYDEFSEGDRYKVRVFKGLDISDSDLETPSRLSEGIKDTMIRYIYIQNTESNSIVNLYPFVSYMFCDDCKREQFFLYNGAKDNERIAYLSYACGHIQARPNRGHFDKRLSSGGLEW
jgi:Squalene-hopene cyclase C-terminal domain/Prenyltransferase and squalene oxidase repeat